MRDVFHGVQTVTVSKGLPAQIRTSFIFLQRYDSIIIKLIYSNGIYCSICITGYSIICSSMPTSMEINKIEIIACCLKFLSLRIFLIVICKTIN